ncbi:MAG: hypothetical protein P8I25_08455 [Ilumatobacter sp.]|nr:hypothetical protein [Ilumatobacter sp.]
MYAVATFLVVAVLSMAFTRLAAGALIATGLPPDVASFQARSAFSGAGFTTTEAENVVNNPDSRKIISTTMFVGNLGTPTLVVTVLVGFLAPGPGNTVERVMVAISGLVLAVLLVTNRPMKRWLVKVGQREAQRRLLPRLDNQVVELLSVGDDFVVGAVQVTAGTGPTVRSLRSIDDALPAVRVLGVQQSGGFFGTPPVDVELAAGDKIIAYGRRSDLQNLVEG